MGKLPKIIIAIGKYFGLDPANGLSDEKTLWIDTLREVGVAEVFEYYYDTGDYDNTTRLIRTCVEINPDLLILNSYDPNNPLYPDIYAISVVKKQLQIPIIAFWYDATHHNFINSIRGVLPYIDLNITPDNPTFSFLTGSDLNLRERFTSTVLPYNQNIYRNLNSNRDIPISFMGQVDGHRSNRIPVLIKVMSAFPASYVSVLNRRDFMPYSHCLEIMQRSRMVLNFCDGAELKQLKGRVFEAGYCGALVLEQANNEIDCFLRPMQDYVPWDTPEDLLEKIRYYLTHDDEYIKITENCQNRLKTVYGYKAFWRQIVDAIVRHSNIKASNERILC